ncbi:hypothetical protein J21TS7_41880 [Paenibacillus cineris]|uniref:Uncharacterized protein n=1 Tax=Paenibacillus cineris TaxID=237530 RepID=A0ABQ4LHJ5_9BACL|nr:hypothetical protein J21TS7_41880 [Paenibacillus cineris]
MINKNGKVVDDINGGDGNITKQAGAGRRRNVTYQGAEQTAVGGGLFTRFGIQQGFFEEREADRA